MSIATKEWEATTAIDPFAPHIMGLRTNGQSRIPAVPTAVRIAGPEEIEWLGQQSLALEGAAPEEILAWAVDRYFPRFTMATGLGPEGCVIISMLAKIEPRVYVFNLDTGYQFRETLELRERIAEKYGIMVDLQRPDRRDQLHHGGPLLPGGQRRDAANNRDVHDGCQPWHLPRADNWQRHWLLMK